MKFGVIISLALLVYLALSVLFAVLRARRRGWIMATVRIGATLLAAVVAFVLAKWIPTLVLDEIFDTLTPQLGEGLGGFISEVPAGIEGVRVLAALIAAPILFFVLFLILRIIFAIVCKIVEVCVPFLKVRSLKALTMSLGAVNAILEANQQEANKYLNLYKSLIKKYNLAKEAPGQTQTKEKTAYYTPNSRMNKNKFGSKVMGRDRMKDTESAGLWGK